MKKTRPTITKNEINHKCITTRTIMKCDQDPTQLNQPSTLFMYLFLQGHPALGSPGTAGRYVVMLKGSVDVCPVEPDCLAALAWWRK